MFLGHTTEDGSSWTPRDRELAKALVLYEATLCGGCGHSTVETGDPDRDGWYDATVVVCAGCMALDKARDSKTKLGPGETYAARLNPSYKPTTP